MTLYIQGLPALQDNLIWILRKENTPLVQVVDPGVSDVVLAYLQKHRLILESILLTHHHHDHSGGIPALLSAFPKARVIRHPLGEGSFVDLFEGAIQAQVLNVPGHTLDHTAFLIEGNLFSGDTLFGAGCGRLFEGSYLQLFSSVEKLKQLPEETLVYCGHEYTLANLAFAKAVEPGSATIEDRILQTKAQLARTGCSLPSTMFQEKRTNPFLRCRDPVIRAAVELQGFLKEDSPLGVFTGLRLWKNQF